MNYRVPLLPINTLFETPRILKKAITANKLLAELKGLALTIPNQSILINTLSLQEAKDSSEIENIITTHDELFKFDKKNDFFSAAAKEVNKYKEALFYGVSKIKKQPISNNLLIEIVQIITDRDAGMRNVPGTKLKNEDQEVIYIPPQNHYEIASYMNNLEVFINTAEICDFDPLIKMAIIHHQFESIHPFFDGNGRTGRILNILYLISENILDIPILYLSRYITHSKSEYYRLLQLVRDENKWEEWILYMLDGLEKTAFQSIATIKSIKTMMAKYKKIIRLNEPNIYSHELINTIFSHPYTKIENITKNVKVSRITSSKYLKKLVDLDLLELVKYKNTNYYVNKELVSLLSTL
jgi:Fic family protein